MKLRGSRAQGLITAVAAVLSLLWGVFLGARHLDGERTVLDRVEAVFADLRFLLAGERKAPDDLVIVAIDDDAIRLAGSWPVPRTVRPAQLTSVRWRNSTGSRCTCTRQPQMLKSSRIDR